MLPRERNKRVIAIRYPKNATIFLFLFLCFGTPFFLLAEEENDSYSEGLKGFPIQFFVEPSKDLVSKNEAIILNLTVKNHCRFPIEIPFARFLNIQIWGGSFNEQPIEGKLVTPKWFGAPSLKVVGPGESYSESIDLRAWKFTGGWRPGKYRFRLAISNINEKADKVFFSLSLFSDDIEVVIR